MTDSGAMNEGCSTRSSTLGRGLSVLAMVVCCRSRIGTFVGATDPAVVSPVAFVSR